MEKITRKMELPISSGEAFRKFVNELNEWWPKEYTWSQSKLKEIRIDGKEGGFCTEIGPHGFRCDWGRVIEYEENKKIRFTWQISPNREPIPDPDFASDVVVQFQENINATIVKFVHLNFENHGTGGAQYKIMMDSEQGWDYILNRYKKYCEG